MQFSLDSYVVLWSPHQNAFQVEAVREMIETNTKIFITQQKGDFIVLGICNSHQEASDLCGEFMALRKEEIQS
jgi:hypothetical protein